MISTRDQQVLLHDAGFDPGTPDGIWGPKSQKAYNSWRKSKYGDTLKLIDIKGASRLEGVHPDLVKMVQRAAQITEQPFVVLEGVRTVERQRRLYAKGASKTMNSRHIPGKNGYGHAVDLGALDEYGQVSWSWPLYYKIADAMKQAAKELDIPVEWGGDWRKFKDGPHYQLPWKQYPA